MSLFSEDAEIVGCVLQKRYVVGEVIGKGGFAVVYKGHDNNLTRDVAIKVPRREIRERQGFRDKFEEEKNRLVQVGRHSSIVSVTDAHVFEGIPYLVLDYMSRGSLRTALHRDRRQSVEEVSAWLRPIADALDFIHDQGVIHLDVKPGNILYDTENQAMLSDFGIARVMGVESGSAENLPGSPNYMAPEAESGVITGQYDQYSLGVIVFHALTGQRPARSAADSRPITPPDDLVTGLPANVSDAVMRAMSVDPARRFPSCREFAAAVSGMAGMGAPTFGAAGSAPTGFSTTAHGSGSRRTALPPTFLPNDPRGFAPSASSGAASAEEHHAWIVEPGESMGGLDAFPPPRTRSAVGGGLPSVSTNDETQLSTKSKKAPPGKLRISKNAWYISASVAACILILVLGMAVGDDPEDATGAGGTSILGSPSQGGIDGLGAAGTGPPTGTSPADPQPSPPSESVPPPGPASTSGSWAMSGSGRTVRFTSPSEASTTVQGTSVLFAGTLTGMQPGDILYVADVRILVERATGAFSQVVAFPSGGLHDLRVTIDNRGAVIVSQQVSLDLR